MKKIIVVTAILSSFAVSSQAAIISGNDIASQFTLQSVRILNGTTQQVGTGYNTLANATSPFVAFNPFEQSPSTFTFNGGRFDFNGFVIAGAWGTQTLRINGFDGANLLFTDTVFVGPSSTTNFVANWSGITAFQVAIGSDFVQNTSLSGNGRHWTLNNIRVNEVASVPLPAAAFLFGPAALGLLGLRRKIN